jgi:hypothetical protein
MPFHPNPTPLRLTIRSQRGQLSFEDARIQLPYLLDEPMCKDPTARVIAAQRLGTGEALEARVWDVCPSDDEVVEVQGLPLVRLYTLRFDGPEFTKRYQHLNRHCERPRRAKDDKGGRQSHLDDEDFPILNLYLSILNAAGIRLAIRVGDDVSHVPVKLAYELRSAQPQQHC